MVEEKAATEREGVADEEKERGSIRFTPTRDLRASPRPLLSEPPHLYRSRGESLALSIPPPSLTLPLAHLRRKLSFSSFLSRSLRLSRIGVIFQSEIYTTLRYVLYTLLLRRAAAFRRGRADLSKYLLNGIAYRVSDQIIFVPTRSVIFSNRNFQFLSLFLKVDILHKCYHAFKLWILFIKKIDKILHETYQANICL